MADTLVCPRCTSLARASDGGPNLGPYRRSARPDDAAKEPLALVPRSHRAGVVVHVCGGCDGAFVTYEAMLRLEEAGRGKTTGRDHARRAFERPSGEVACARCGGAAARRKWGVSGLVFVDVCVDIDCRGVWLDAGELEAISGTAALREDDRGSS